MPSTMEKVVVCTLILSALPSSKASISSWFSDAGQIVGDGWERGVRFVGLPLPATKGQHTCGDEVYYKDSELNKWNFHGIHSYYKCCEGYTRVSEYDEDCNKHRNECNNSRHDCDQICVVSTPGYSCDCNAGYRLTGNRTCKDINECLNNPCDQICSNTNGSYHCRCEDGFEMKEGRCATLVPPHFEKGTATTELSQRANQTITSIQERFSKVSPSNPGPSLKPWQKALIAIGCFLFLLVSAALCCCCCCSKDDNYHIV